MILSLSLHTNNHWSYVLLPPHMNSLSATRSIHIPVIYTLTSTLPALIQSLNLFYHIDLTKRRALLHDSLSLQKLGEASGGVEQNAIKDITQNTMGAKVHKVCCKMITRLIERTYYPIVNLWIKMIKYLLIVKYNLDSHKRRFLGSFKIFNSIFNFLISRSNEFHN